MRPSAVAVAKLDSGAARMVARRLARSSSRKAGGTYICVFSRKRDLYSVTRRRGSDPPGLTPGKPHRLGEEAVALVADGLVISPGHDCHLLHVEAFRQIPDALGDLGAGADERVGAHPVDAGALRVRIGMRGGDRGRFKRGEGAHVA